MRSLLLQTYVEARKLHDETLDRIPYLENSVKSMDPAMIVDTVYALKKTNEVLDDMRKKLDKVTHLAERLGCVIAVQSAEAQLHGRWSTGTTGMREQPGVPNPEKEPEAYVELMRALGASEQVIEDKTLRPSFEAVGEYMAKLGEEGRPLPEALQSVRKFPVYSISTRCRSREGMTGIAAMEAGKYDGSPELLWTHVVPSDIY